MLYAGYAERDITPPVGAPMAAFPQGPGRPRRGEGARDPLLVKALALSDGTTTVCLCAGDVVFWRDEDVAQIRQDVAGVRRDIAVQQLLLTATHTHASGENAYVFGGWPEDPWPRALRAAAAATMLTAVEDLAPATLSFGQIPAPFNHNRRVTGPNGRARLVMEYEAGVTEGPTDPLLSVLRVDRVGQGNSALSGDEDTVERRMAAMTPEGSPAGAMADSVKSVLWTHWTAHALTLGAANTRFSADYPGAMAALVQSRRPGTKVLFTNGAAGNVHPRWCGHADGWALDHVGALLAEQVLAAAESARPLPATPLVIRSTTLRFPNRADPTQTGCAEVACLRLGALTIGFLPGEPFVEFQLQFRAALAPRPALLTGYANGAAGYIPTQAAYAEGGYGVDLFPGDPARYSRTMVPPGTGERLLEILERLAREALASEGRGGGTH